ncbi:hypothetical protein [Accumulibacter sp.]|uniref:hypothetical protein n=1 Tax=Accumulibacter sp. TaxID=2053492 RepID=UPI00262B3A4D|nr:hypothetical protein [Accumulibacter sp.]
MSEAKWLQFLTPRRQPLRSRICCRGTVVPQVELARLNSPPNHAWRGMARVD